MSDAEATEPVDGATRRAVRAALAALAEAPHGELMGRLADLSAPGATWRVSCPVDECDGPAEAAARAFAPLRKALPDMERRDVIFVAGRFEGHAHVAAIGSYLGTFARPWLGIPPTGRPAALRYGEVYRLDGAGRVTLASLLWDVPDLMRQAGVWPFAPSLGAEGLWPAPLTADGMRLDPSSPAEGAASLAQTLAMHRTLAEHDDRRSLTRESLLSMPQKAHWHPRMMWYGPAGIGAARGLAGFVDDHQLPFRRAFRRPQGTAEEVAAERARLGAGHHVRIGDGPYSVTAGWPSVAAAHEGGGFMGLPPTGRPVTMRVMDAYLHHEGLTRENWVPLDVLDLLRQMGVDVLGRLRETHPSVGR